MEKKLTPQQYEDLQKYLDGLMVEKERQMFEHALQQNALLREQLQFELELEQHLTAMADPGDEISTFLTETEKAAGSASVKQLQEQIAHAAAEWKQRKKNLNEADQPAETTAFIPVPKAAADLPGLSHDRPPMVARAGEGNFGDLPAIPKAREAIQRLRRYPSLIAACVVTLLGIGIWFFVPHPEGNGNAVLVKNDTPKTNPVDNPGIVQHPVDNGPNRSPSTPPTIAETPSLPKPSSQQLYKQYYKQDATPTQLPEYFAEALPTEPPEYLAEAFSDLDAGKYTTILEIDVADIPRSRGVRGPDDERNNVEAIVRYYQGFAYLNQGRTDKAIKAFKDVRKIEIAAPTDSLHYKAMWYLAMSYLKKGNLKDAKSLFKNLAASKRAGKYYRSKSNEILKQIE